ncbi:MAG TPA: DUF4173 domain-containing protein [Acidimicrobiales bacterium]
MTGTITLGPSDPTRPPAPPGVGDVTVEHPADRAVVVAVAFAAVATDAGLRAGVCTVGSAVLTVGISGALVLTGRVTNRRVWPLLGVAAVLGVALATRTSPWLLVPDVLAAGGLVALAAAMARDGDPLDLTLPRVVERALAVTIHGVVAPGFLAAARPRRRDKGSLAGVVRGALVAAPVVVVLGLLLASADPVFASVFRLPTDAGQLAGHVVLLTLGAWSMAGLLRAASGRVAPELPPRPAWLGRTEAAVVLGGMVVLFAGFAAAQVLAATGGADHVLRTEGLTYAEYARSGFFQLLAVAAITLGVVLAVRATVTGELTGSLLVLAELAAGLTVVIVVVAVRRLHLYEQAFGLTMLRLFSFLAAVWIGLVFILLAFQLARAWRRHWFVPASVALALAGLIGLHAVNPEAVVVRRNLDHYERTGRFDMFYPDELSDDAVPTILPALDRLPAGEERDFLRERLCERADDRGVWSYNVSSRAAEGARSRHC